MAATADSFEKKSLETYQNPSIWSSVLLGAKCFMDLRGRMKKVTHHNCPKKRFFDSSFSISSFFLLLFWEPLTMFFWSTKNPGELHQLFDVLSYLSKWGNCNRFYVQNKVSFWLSTWSWEKIKCQYCDTYLVSQLEIW